MISTLTTQNLILSAPSSGDLSGINDFEMRNNDHLKKWESTTSAKNQPVYEETQKRLDGWIKECEEGRSARFFIRPKDNRSKIIGFCNFTQIFHGSFQACYLGYKID
jgi:[ribosomal protein S5]-alanine N-acetyltransferase